MGRPTLHLVSGLMGCGKSTLAMQLAAEHPALLIGEDEWTSVLWPDEITSLESYVDRSRRLRRVLWPHVLQLLHAGTSVVLDFAANTRGQRASLADLVLRAGPDVDHLLHFLDTPVAVCRSRVAIRNATGLHPYAPSADDFDRFTSLFQPPTPEEGFAIQRHSASPSA